MYFESKLTPETEVQIKRITCSRELPPFDAGLTAALRRAYAPPLVANDDEFDALLAKLV